MDLDLLQKKYNDWRKNAEERNVPDFLTDCAFQGARKEFSEACHMQEEISMELMLRCEARYDKIIRN